MKLSQIIEMNRNRKYFLQPQSHKSSSGDHCIPQFKQSLHFIQQVNLTRAIMLLKTTGCTLCVLEIKEQTWLSPLNSKQVIQHCIDVIFQNVRHSQHTFKRNATHYFFHATKLCILDQISSLKRGTFTLHRQESHWLDCSGRLGFWKRGITHGQGSSKCVTQWAECSQRSSDLPGSARETGKMYVHE